jgi:1-acyl-sn-glycerol-3-phosphate acyltransferase
MSLKSTHILENALYPLYGAYVWLTFLILGGSTLLIALLPGLTLEARRGLAHRAAAAFLRVSGMKVSVENAESLPAGPCMVVSNHASYLDGVVLKAVLPARFCFVIKKEVVKVPLVGTLLRRIGSEFVDRFNHHSGAMDARRILKAATRGQALVFFPEGTIVQHPGVARFQTGAFAIATRAQLPVVPVAIRGTRWILPDGRFLPRPGSIAVSVLRTIEFRPDVDRHELAREQLDESRGQLLAALGEPDLDQVDGLAQIRARKS